MVTWHGTKTTNFVGCEDEPAIECPNGIKEWWKNGKLDSNDGLK